MQIGAFELREPVPELRDPHMFIVLQPWIDVGSVGSLAVGTLERQFAAQELGRLRRPGTFYDFTRYRPMLYREEGRRRVEVPNTVARYAHWPERHDLVFLHALEPHQHGEDFVESVAALAEHLGVRRSCQVGAMYGAGPHTRPLGLTGSASEGPVQEQLTALGVRSSTYEGPTSIMTLASEMARERGVATLHLLVQLPPYARLEQDFRGQETLLRVLDALYGFGVDLEPIAQQGARQYAELTRAVQRDPAAQALVRQLEQAYDAQAQQESREGPPPPLPPAVERLLREMEEGRGPS